MYFGSLINKDKTCEIKIWANDNYRKCDSLCCNLKWERSQQKQKFVWSKKNTNGLFNGWTKFKTKIEIVSVYSNKVCCEIKALRKK